MLPPFSDEGDLPPGIYVASLEEVLVRFGSGTLQRQAVADRLRRVYELANSTGKVARFIIFGSFVTAEPEPNDVDIVLLMDDTFDLSGQGDEAAIVFHHLEADAFFGASVFWSCRSSALGGEQSMIEYWQVRRDGGQRGIVEVLPEKP